MKPIRGTAAGSPFSRQICTTKSGWEARTPRLTASLNSADRVIRFSAGSTPLDPQVRQSVNDGPCAGGPTRWRARHGCASAAGTRAHEHGGDCSVGRSACPWPRLHSPVSSGRLGRRTFIRSPDPATAVAKLRSNRRGPGKPVAAVSPAFGRLFEGTDHAWAGQTALFRSQLSRQSRSPLLLAHWVKPVNFWLRKDPDNLLVGFLVTRLLLPIRCALRDHQTLYTSVDNHVDSYGPLTPPWPECEPRGRRR